MSRTAIVLAVLVLLAGIASAWLLRSPEPGASTSLTTADLSLTGHRSDGSEAWTLSAAFGEMTDDRQELDSVSLTFLRDDDEPMVAEASRLVRTSSGSTLSGNVTIVDGDTTLATEEMIWDERNDVLEAGSVHLTLGNASLTGDAFHHDLSTGITTVSGDVFAQLTYDGTSYSAHGKNAEAKSDRLHLTGDVAVDASSGDTYACEQLAVLPSEETIELSGNVSGTWQSSAFTADAVRLDPAGVRLRGRVTIDLEMVGMEPQS